LLLTSDLGSDKDVCDPVVDMVLRKPVRQSQLCDAILKLTNSPEQEIKLPTPDRLVGGRRRSARILVAEDNIINQFVTTNVLAKAGYSCDLVPTGREALRALTENTYDIVLMDCQMPEMDGIEATRLYRGQESVRAERRSRPTPIIALTANAMIGDRQRCIEAGMTDYLSKPVDPIALIELIQQYLSEAM
jgi:CheY-like chemotaxis protein